MIESRQLKHCVHSYRRHCESGRSAIFSLRKHQLVDGRTQVENCVTIEVDRKSRRIVQVRGKADRCHRSSQIPALHQWAAKFKLTF